MAIGMLTSDTMSPVNVISRIGTAEKPMNVSYIVLIIWPNVQPDLPKRRDSRWYSTTASVKQVHAMSANVTRLRSWNCAKHSATRRSTSKKLPVVNRERGGIANLRMSVSNVRLVQTRIGDSARLTRL